MTKLYVTIGGYAAAFILFLLWRGAVKDVEAEILACNVDELQETIEAQELTRQSLLEAHERQLTAERELRTQAEKARQNVADEARELQTQVAGQRDRITQLEFEADIDEIPEFDDCSIVYIPSRMLYAEGCTATVPGGSPDYRVCVGAEGLNEADSAFTNITVGDAFKHWGSDRAALGQCNAQLAAIESLEIPDVETN